MMSLKSGFYQVAAYFSCLSEKWQISAVSLKQPIFIWGTGRCGSHLVMDVLSLHPDLCYLVDRKRKKKGIWGDWHHGEMIPEVLREHPVPAEAFGYAWASAGAPLHRVKKATAESAKHINRDEVTQKYKNLRHRMFWQTKPSYRLLDKCPRYLMLVDVLNDFFPDSFHIFCLRDPRLIANSILRLLRFSAKETSGITYAHGFFANMFPQGYEEVLSLPLVARVAWQVEKLIEIGLDWRDLLGDRLLTFRYEALLQDAHGASEQLFNACGLRPFSTIRAWLPKQFPDYAPQWPASCEKWEASFEIAFSSDEWQQMQNLQKLAVRLGYDPQRPGCFLESSKESSVEELAHA